jgi:hypothetical protein
MNELRDSAIFIRLVAVLTTYQAFTVLTSRTYQLTEDARATQLVAGCELWDIVPPSQPTRTLVLACPGVDRVCSFFAFSPTIYVTNTMTFLT